VDGRYALWRSDYGSPSPLFLRFFLSIEDGMNNRIKKWHDKRQKTLFGQDVPDPIFLLKSVNVGAN
jgi:hypothetical protein